MNKMDKNKQLPINKLDFTEYEALLSAVGQAALVSVANKDGDIIYANDKFVEVSKYTRVELIGRNHRILKSGHQPYQLFVDLWKTISSGKVWRGEIKNRAKDGTFYWVDTSIVPILDQSGHPERFLAVRFLINNKKYIEEELERQNRAMLNILEDQKILEDKLKKQMEEVEILVKKRTNELEEKTLALKDANAKVSKNWYAIQKERATLSASISSLPLGFIVIDPDLNVLTINATAKKYLQLISEPKNLKDIDRIFSINFNMLKLIETTRQNKTPSEIKEAILDNRYIHLTLVPILSQITGEKEYLGSVILIGDITERKLMERSRNEFFSIASHELRTPLTAIRGNVQLINMMYKELIKDADLKEMLSDIHDSAVRLINIVNDFLNTSRLEMNRQEFKNDNFDLTVIVNNISQELKPQFIQKNLKFDINLNQHEKIIVFADKDRTKEVLVNLIGNALKFTDKGSISVYFENEKDFIKTFVKDTGIGISYRNRNLLFHKFQQAEENIFTRDVTQGTGLGLYICRLLVEKMGGRISLVESKENAGSTFAFTLPVGKTIGDTPVHRSVPTPITVN